jgi:hypothetical protein
MPELVLFFVRVRVEVVIDCGASHRVKDSALVWKWVGLEVTVGTMSC